MITYKDNLLKKINDLKSVDFNHVFINLKDNKLYLEFFKDLFYICETSFNVYNENNKRFCVSIYKSDLLKIKRFLDKSKSRIINIDYDNYYLVIKDKTKTIKINKSVFNY